MRLTARITLDLPSDELLSRPGRIARFFGLPALPSGQERVVGSTLTILDGFLDGYFAAGVTNVLGLRIDGVWLYRDERVLPGDLDRLIVAVDDQRSRLGARFEHMHLVMEHAERGLSYLLDAHIRGTVPTGTEEVQIEVVARLQDLLARPREAAVDYRVRVLEAVADRALTADALRDFDALLRVVEEALRKGTLAHSCRRSAQSVVLPLPDRASLRALAARPFGEHERVLRDAADLVQVPRPSYYRDLPLTYLDLLLADALRRGAAAGIPASCRVLSASGGLLGEARHAPSFRGDIPALSAIASEQAAVALDVGRLLDDPALNAALDALAEDE